MSTHLPDIDSLWDFSNPAGTEEKFRALIPECQNLRTKSYYNQLLTQIARTQGLQRKFDEADATLDMLKSKLARADAVTKIRYNLERGRVRRSSGHSSEALPFFTEAMKLAKEAKQDNLLIDAIHMVALVSPTDKQNALQVRALKIAEKSKDPIAQQWCGSLYNNIGWTHFEMKEYETAKSYFESGLKFRLSRNQAGGAAIMRWCIAKSLRFMNQIEESLAIQQDLLQQIESGEMKPDGYVYEEMGECLLGLGRDVEARSYFKRAYEILSENKWMVADEPERLHRLKSLS